MIFNLLLIFSLIFIGIPGMIYYSLRKDINKIMKRINPNFTGHVNNSLDFFRIIKAFRHSEDLSIREKSKLRLSIILVSISWIAGLFFLTTIIFFNEQILD